MWWKRRKKKIRVRELILEDENGNETAHLGTDETGKTVLSFWDDAKKARLYVGLEADKTPRIGLTYAQGKGSIQLEANDRLQSAALMIAGPGGRVQVLLGIARNGTPALVLYDDDGRLLYPIIAEGDDGGDGPAGFDWDDLLRG